MAIISVSMTSESFDHLMEVVGVFVQRVAGTVQINPALQGLVDILHDVAAGATLAGPPVPGGTSTAPTKILTISTGTIAATRRADLNTMLTNCLTSINALNAVNRDLVLEI